QATGTIAWEVLSKRERQIVRLASGGATDKAIAANLGIGVGSVKTYWERIRQKFQVNSRTEILSSLLRSEHEGAMRAAEQSQDLLVSILEHTDHAVALLDPAGPVVLYSNGW